MEVCSPYNTADHLGSSHRAKSSEGPSTRSHQNSSALSMNDLKACLNDLKNKEGFVLSNTGVSLSSGQDGADEKLVDSDESVNEIYNSAKCLSKSATFPQSSGLKSSGHVAFSEKENQGFGELSGDHKLNCSTKEFGQHCRRSLSFPTSLELVSAMKGSRGRQGIPPKKLSVTWSPDVYDPIPTSVSHVPSSKQYRYRNDGKKSGKNKQRGSSKSSRSGGKGKDKKWKNGGRSSYIVKPFHEESGVVVSVPGKGLMLESQLRPAEMVF